MKVFFDKRQSVAGNSSFSPSAGKPLEVLRSWQALGLPIEIGKVKPISRVGMSLAHDSSYVNAILDCRQTNGFGNTSQEVADSLPWTTGSLYSAAEYVVKNGGAAASLTSGFHHAGHGFGGGFCTLNGLVIAATVLKELDLVKRVGILDLDAHYGNGTENIIKKLDLDWIQHWTFGGEGIRRSNSEEWLKELPKIVESFKDCDVLIYQAGADPHVLDPLGGSLKTEQMVRRDRIVFETCKKLGLPVAWNLAGGYQNPLRKVLNLHDNTAIECVRIFEPENLGEIKSHEGSKEEDKEPTFHWSDWEEAEEEKEEIAFREILFDSYESDENEFEYINNFILDDFKKVS